MDNFLSALAVVRASDLSKVGLQVDIRHRACATGVSRVCLSSPFACFFCMLIFFVFTFGVFTVGSLFSVSDTIG